MGKIFKFLLERIILKKFKRLDMPNVVHKTHINIKILNFILWNEILKMVLYKKILRYFNNQKMSTPCLSNKTHK